MPDSTPERPVLDIREATKFFGGLCAVKNFSLGLPENALWGLIGPNGAGKSALLNCISGFYQAQRGEITFGGTVLTHLPVHKVVKEGIARTFQHPRLCPDLSVLDNIIAGMHLFARENTLAQMLWFGPALREEIRLRREAEKFLSLLRMESLGHATAGSLPHGLRKKVELIRALALQPRLLLLDEPMSGMSAEEKDEVAAIGCGAHYGGGGISGRRPPRSVVGGGSLGEVAPFLILLMVLFIRPFGVFGLKEIERV